MNQLKRILGVLWMVIAPVLFILLIISAVYNIDAKGTKDINKPLPWIIIIGIYTPIVIALMIFGWYAFKGEYDKLPVDSKEV